MVTEPNNTRETRFLTKGLSPLFSLVLLLSFVVWSNLTQAQTPVTKFLNSDCTSFNGNGNSNACAASGGGTGAYNSAANAMSGMAANITAAGSNLTYTLKVSSTSNGVLGTFDLVTGWTRDVTHRLKITCDDTKAGSCHVGVWDATKARISVNGNDVVNMTNAASGYADFVHMQIENTGNTSDTRKAFFISGMTGDVNIAENLIRSTAGGLAVSDSSLIYIRSSANNNTIRMWDNIIYDSGGNGVTCWLQGTGQTCIIQNNTIYGSRADGIYYDGDGISETIRLQNNLIYASTGNDYSIGGAFNTSTINTNLSEDPTSPTVALRSKTVSFVNTGTKDFHLASSDVGATGVGTDLSADSGNAFTKDIDGQTIVAPWPAGADQYQASIAYLNHEICGDGIDNDNSAGSGWGVDLRTVAAGDTACTGTGDNDRDGYLAANDCDDNNPRIFPNPYDYMTTGCSGGQSRRCISNGTTAAYTACATFVCPGSRCFYYDPVSGNDSNAGTSAAAAFQHVDRMDNGCSSGTCITPTANDYHLMMTGVFTQATGTGLLYVNSRDGTASNPIVVTAAPGAYPIFDPTGTTEGTAIYAVNSDYWVWSKIQFRDYYGDVLGNEGGDHWKVIGNYFNSNRGGTGANRYSVKHTGDISGVDGFNEFANNVCYDNACIIHFNDPNSLDHHNTIFEANAGLWARAGLHYKHGIANSNWLAYGNVFFNFAKGAALTGFGQPPITFPTSGRVYYNFFDTIGDEAINVAGDPGGPAFLDSIEIDHNTIVNSQVALTFTNSNDAGLDSKTGPIRWHDNIVTDSSANYTGNATGLLVIDSSGDATARTYWSSSNRLTFKDDCYYNPVLPALTGAFDFYPSGGGSSYSAAGWPGAGAFVSGESFSDPGLATGSFLPTLTCSGKGYQFVPGSTPSGGTGRRGANCGTRRGQCGDVRRGQSGNVFNGRN